MLWRVGFVLIVSLATVCWASGVQPGGGAGNAVRKDWLFRVGEDGEKRVNRTRVVPVLRLGDSFDNPYVGFGFVSPVPVGWGAVEGLHKKFRRALKERGLGRHLSGCVRDSDCDLGQECRDFLFGKFCVFGSEERELQPVPVPVPVRTPGLPSDSFVRGSLLVI